MMKTDLSDDDEASQLDPYSDDSDGEKKSGKRFSLKILNLPTKTKEAYLRESIKNEYKKYGAIKNIELAEKDDNRTATVYMSERKEIKRAVEATDGRFLFAALIDVYDHSNNEKHEFPFFSSRTLFIGNLEKITTYEDLRRTFFKYGKILKIDLKKVRGVNQYAFIQFANLEDARRAVHKMQGERLGKNQVVTCYARSIKTQVLWFHGISLVSDESTYRRQFEHFGTVRSLVLDRVKSQLLVAFSDIASANTAYLEYKEKGRKLNNTRMSCDFCSEELLQSVLYDDIVKKHGLTRTEIQNNWSEIQNKLKRSHDDDDMRSIGSDYEYTKYMELSSRIERDSKNEYRERYRSRDSRSRERYRSKRSRSRSRGRMSPRHKKKKSRPILERVHSPSPNHRSSHRRSSRSTSTTSRSRSHSPEMKKGKKKKKHREKRRKIYDDDEPYRKIKTSSRTSSRSSYFWKDDPKKKTDRPRSWTSTSPSSSNSRSPSPKQSRKTPDKRKSPDDVNNLEKLDERQLEEERRRLQSHLNLMKGRKITIENDFHQKWQTNVDINIEIKKVTNKDEKKDDFKVQIKQNPIAAKNPKISSDSISGTIVSSSKSSLTQLNNQKVKLEQKLPVELPLLDRDLIKLPLKEDSDEHIEAPHYSPSDEIKTKIITNDVPLAKKTTPVILPILPILPKLDTKSREKPREPPIRSHPQTPEKRLEIIVPVPSQTPSEIPSTSMSGTVSTKFDKLKNAAKQDKERLEKEKNEKKKDERKKEIEKKKSELARVKSKPSQAPNPKKDRLIRGLPLKRFLDDPTRTIEPHEFSDFRKELLQVLQEVKQEVLSKDACEDDIKPILLDSPTRTNPSLMDYFSFNNTQPLSPPYTERKMPAGVRLKKRSGAKNETEKRTGGVMELAKIQTYLNRILRPEEFSIQSATTKRLDIFEEDRKRIMRSPWLIDDDEQKPQLVSKPGVFDFFPDWSDAILTDLNQLRTAVDQVLGIAPVIDDISPCQQIDPVNNVEYSLMPQISTHPKIEIKEEQNSPHFVIKNEPNVPVSDIKPNALTSSTEVDPLSNSAQDADSNSELIRIASNSTIKTEPKWEVENIEAKLQIQPLIKKEITKEEEKALIKKEITKEEEKALTKKIVQERELNELLKDAETNFNPSDIFDPAADSEDDNLSQTSKENKKLKLEKIKNLKKERKRRKERDKKRKMSSDNEKLKDKKRIECRKKVSESDSNSLTSVNSNALQDQLTAMPHRKISEFSDMSAGSPMHVSQSLSPASDLMSPEPNFDNQVHSQDEDPELDSCQARNKSIRERMEHMAKEHAENRKKNWKKTKATSSQQEDASHFGSNATQEAVRSLSFENDAELDEKTDLATQNVPEPPKKPEQTNDEIDAALAGLEEDFNPAPIKKEKPENPSPMRSSVSSVPSTGSSSAMDTTLDAKLPALHSRSSPSLEDTAVQQVRNDTPKVFKLKSKFISQHKDSFKQQNVSNEIHTPSPASAAIQEVPAKCDVVNYTENTETSTANPLAPDDFKEFSDDETLKIVETDAVPPASKPTSMTQSPEVQCAQNKSPKLHPKYRRHSQPDLGRSPLPHKKIVLTPAELRRTSIGSDSSALSTSPVVTSSNKSRLSIDNHVPQARKLSQVSQDGSDSPSIKLPKPKPTTAYISKQSTLNNATPSQTNQPIAVVEMKSQCGTSINKHVIPKPALAIRTPQASNKPTQQHVIPQTAVRIISQNQNVVQTVVQVPQGTSMTPKIVTNTLMSPQVTQQTQHQRLCQQTSSLSRVIHKVSTQGVSQQCPSQAKQGVQQQTQSQSQQQPILRIQPNHNQQAGTRSFQLATGTNAIRTTTAGYMLQPQNVIQMPVQTSPHYQRVLVSPNQSGQINPSTTKPVVMASGPPRQVHQVVTQPGNSSSQETVSSSSNAQTGQYLPQIQTFTLSYQTRLPDNSGHSSNSGIVTSGIPKQSLQQTNPPGTRTVIAPSNPFMPPDLQTLRFTNNHFHSVYQPIPSKQSITGASSLSNQPPDRQEQREIAIMRLVQRYRIIWQGMLCLKNDSATVQLHFISGSRQMAENSLPDHLTIQSASGVNLPQLRIIQRMRLEQPQVDTVQNKMYDPTLSCIMIALPCGRDKTDVHSQTNSLREKFIEYLSAKHAAGIVNTPKEHGQQFVLHIFPPCNFVTNNLSRLAPDFLQSVQDLPMLMVVITDQ